MEGLVHLASLFDVQLLGGNKEDAVADVEHEDCRLKADAAGGRPQGIQTPHYSSSDLWCSYDYSKHQSDQLT